MGQSQSSDITVRVYNDRANRDYIGPLLYTVMNFVFVGFLIGVFMYEYEISLWTFYYGRGFHLSRYLKGLHLCAHVVSWYIIYTIFYMYVVESVIKQIVINLIQFKYEVQVLTILQFAYGWWLSKEIMGGWLDLQSSTNCLEAKNCRGFFQERFMLMMESTCEYFGGYDYNELYETYNRDPNNACERAFRYMPAFLTDAVSCGIAAICLKLVAPNP